jgi:hypothetical protein
MVLRNQSDFCVVSVFRGAPACTPNQKGLVKIYFPDTP